MPPEHPHSSLPWPLTLLFASLMVLLLLARLIRERQERRDLWANVLANARAWARSVGGTLERVSEQPAVYGAGSGRGGRILVARRYRITFIDRDGAQCVALLRYTCCDGNWACEKLTRDPSLQAGGEAVLQTEAESSAEGYARRHRAKVGHVPVIFAPPQEPKPPRRST